LAHHLVLFTTIDDRLLKFKDVWNVEQLKTVPSEAKEQT